VAVVAPYGAGSDAVAAALDDLARRHAEPHRRYHTLEHVAEVLDVVDELVGLVPAGSVDADAVRLAVWLHDAVYDPRSGGSEAASARLAAEVLPPLGVPAPVVSNVCRLVELTAGHEAAARDADGVVVADADLAVLGAPPARYRRYAADVRAEHAHVDDGSWRAGRAAVLRGFLDRHRIYRTDVLHDRLDARARANLTAELASLT
jgi:predicted metal-dependent HD superfamily phosphohydrolase